jgi:uncharacterized protein YkwD
MRYILAVVGCCVSLLTPSTAWAAPEAAPGPDAAARVVELTNAERAAAGLAPLTASPQLGDAARAYASILTSGDCFAHTCGPVPSLADRGERAGYTGWTSLGENIAAGQPSPEEVVRRWMASPGHRANILDPTFAEIGVATAAGGPYDIYWVQAFGACTR